MLRPSNLATVATLSIVFISGSAAWAGCNCQGGGGASVSYSPYAYPAMLGSQPTLGGYEGEVVYGPQPAPYAPMMSGDFSMGPGNYGPPPGTLGQTYQRSSRPVPVKKHPRTGMVDVHVVGASEVIVNDTNEFRTEDELDGWRDDKDPNVWHFASEPLYPGLPHIFRVEARFDGPTGSTSQVRYIRLIMGRIVEVSF